MPFALAALSAASVSAVSPDCEMIIQYLFISEFRSDLCADRDLRKVLDNIFAHHSRVPCRAASNYVYLADPLQDIFSETGGSQIDLSVVDDAVESILYGFRLLVDLFDHEVLKTALFSRFGIPCYVSLFDFDLVSVEVKEVHFTRKDPDRMKIVNIVDVAGVLKARNDSPSAVPITIGLSLRAA